MHYSVSAGLVFMVLVVLLVGMAVRLRRHQHPVPDRIRSGAHSIYGRVVRRSHHESARPNDYRDSNQVQQELYANPAYHAQEKQGAQAAANPKV